VEQEETTKLKDNFFGLPSAFCATLSSFFFLIFFSCLGFFLNAAPTRDICINYHLFNKNSPSFPTRQKKREATAMRYLEMVMESTLDAVFCLKANW